MLQFHFEVSTWSGGLGTSFPVRSLNGEALPRRCPPSAIAASILTKAAIFERADEIDGVAGDGLCALVCKDIQPEGHD